MAPPHPAGATPPGGDPVIGFARDDWTVTAEDATLPVSVIIGTGLTPTVAAG